MKAVMMVANRDVVLRTIRGSQTFVKDEPALVSPHLVESALQIGILPVDAKEKLFPEREETEEEPIDVGSRNEAIRRAIELIYERNDPDDFTTGATPKLKAVAKVAKLKKVNTIEVKAVLDKRNEALLQAELEQSKQKKAAAKKAAAEDPPDNDL